MYDMDYGKNGWSLYRLYKEEFNYYFDENPPEETKKSVYLLGKLIKEQGSELAVKIVSFACSDWDKVKNKYYSVPLTNAIWGLRYNIIKAMKNEEESIEAYIAEREGNPENFAEDIF